MVYSDISHKRARHIVFCSMLLVTCTLFSPHISQGQSPGPGTPPTNNPPQSEDTLIDPSYKLLEPLPCLTGKEPNCVGGQIEKINFADAIQYAFNLLIALSSAAAVFMIVWGGFRYVTTDSWRDKREGKEIFFNAIIGLLMILGAFLVLRTVNPKLVAIPAGIPPVNVPGNHKLSPSDFFSRLNNDANAYRISAEEFNQARDRELGLKREQNALTEKLKTLSEGSPEWTEIKTKIARLDGQINSARSNMRVKYAQEVLLEVLQIQTAEKIRAARTPEEVRRIGEGQIQRVTQEEAKISAELKTLSAYTEIQRVAQIALVSRENLALKQIGGEIEKTETYRSVSAGTGGATRVPLSPQEKNSLRSRFSSRLDTIHDRLNRITNEAERKQVETEIYAVRDLLAEKLK